MKKLSIYFLALFFSISFYSSAQLEELSQVLTPGVTTETDVQNVLGKADEAQTSPVSKTWEYTQDNQQFKLRFNSEGILTDYALRTLEETESVPTYNTVKTMFAKASNRKNFATQFKKPISVSGSEKHEVFLFQNKEEQLQLRLKITDNNIETYEYQYRQKKPSTINSDEIVFIQTESTNTSALESNLGTPNTVSFTETMERWIYEGENFQLKIDIDPSTNLVKDYRYLERS